MPDAKKLLVDADAFVALNDIEDSNHAKAIEYSSAAEEQGLQLFTSDPALGEAITVTSQKVGLIIAVEFAEDILASQMEIIEVDAALRRSALKVFKKQTSKNSRFTDCVNMAIMKEKGIDTIFSFDRQYKANKLKRFGIDK